MGPLGEFIRKQVIPPGMSVKEAASRLGVSRPALSNLLNGNAGLSPEMAARLEKSFGADAQKLLALQADAGRDKQREAVKAVPVRKYVPNFLSIKARRIEEWADGNLAARNQLPVLLRRLVHTTGQDLKHVDFPGYDNAERKGSDGLVKSDSATAWIPEGSSYWEYGVTDNAERKAEKDYAARLKSVPAKERAQSTFVFVTPRNWPGKNEWAKRTASAGHWKAVRALDASDLEQWLEESIPAQIWLAEKLGLPTTGFRTLDSCWDDWAAASEPRMSPEIFAPSVAAHRQALEGWLGRQPDRPFVVAADSRGEALAFLACLFDALGAGRRENDLAAVFESAETLRALAASSSPFIPIVMTDEAERELANVYRDHHSIVIRPRNAIESEPDIPLDLLTHQSFEKALAAMGIDGDAVEGLARESGRSPTILRRRLSRVEAIRSPEWTKDATTARELIPMALIGAWSTKSAADTEILAVLANRPYEQIEQDVQHQVQLDDPPVWSAGSYRGVASKVDLIFAVSRFVTPKDLSEFFTLAEYVLSESDPSLEMPEEDRWKAGIYGKVRDHSTALRAGVCETLVILSVHGNDLFKDRLGVDVDARVATLIDRLLTPLTLEKLMSHERDLPKYAEAAPETFLSLLEADLRTNEPVVLGLLRPSKGGLFGSCPRTGLLWALECLAWKPQNLPRVIAILAALSKTKISDNWANKPIGSLEAIFRSWMPQTAASLEDRIKALELLVRRFPDVAWEICVEQFGSDLRTGDYSYRPHWRNDASGAGKPLDTWEPIIAFNRKTLDIALAWPRHNDSTLGDLVERITDMPKEAVAALWELIEAWANNPATVDRAKAALRERIRRFALTRVGRKRVPEQDTRSRAREVYDKLQPADPVVRHGWLFAKQWVEESAEELDDDKLDLQRREERIYALRQSAIADVWTLGFDRVLQLLTDSEAPTTVGQYLGLHITELSEREALLRKCLAVSGELEQKVDACILGFLWSIDAARQTLLRAVTPQLETNRLLRLLKSAPFEKDTWELAKECGGDVVAAYWNDVQPQWNRRHSDAELNELIDHLLDAQRPRAAFFVAHMDWEKLETSRLKRVLAAVASVNAEPQDAFRLDAHDVSEALQELDGRAGVTVDEMAQLEFRYISALDHSRHGIPNLERQVAESPLLYTQLMAILWKRSDGGKDPPEWRIEDPERRSAVWTAMHRLHNQMKRIPGTNADGVLVAGALLDWLKQVRTLAEQYGRADITDHCLGQLLAKSPPESTGAWPCPAVCEAMEAIATPHLAEGFSIQVRNSRGAVWRGEGGSQERGLATDYRALSKQQAFEHPFVARVLESLAESYNREAEWHDSEAKVSKRLRH